MLPVAACRRSRMPNTLVSHLEIIPRRSMTVILRVHIAIQTFTEVRHTLQQRRPSEICFDPLTAHPYTPAA